MRFNWMSSRKELELIASGKHPNQKWRRWFAWYPVRVDETQIAWLEDVSKRQYWYGDPHGWRNEYRPIPR